MKENLAVLRDVLYLAACAIHGETPSPARVSQMDGEAAVRFAEKHSIDGLVCCALRRAKPSDPRYWKRLGLCMEASDQRQAAWRKVEKGLEARGVWYAPLKGMLLQDCYPEKWMRQMCDYDVLIDPARRRDVRDLMRSLGYEVKRFGHAKEDLYANAKGVSFEMHVALFDPAHVIAPLYKYYERPESRLVPSPDGSNCRRAFREADFYLYITAHAYHHHDWAGHGLRNFVDLFFYLGQKKDELNWDYVEAECRKQGTADYEKRMRSIPFKLFSLSALRVLDSETDWLDRLGLAEEERELFLNCAFSGVYGSEENRLNRRLRDLQADRDTGKASLNLRYLLRRCFPPREAVALKYPRLGRVPVLWRVGYLLRVFSALKQTPRFLRELMTFSRLTKQ